jgi:hypothetical protein
MTQNLKNIFKFFTIFIVGVLFSYFCFNFFGSISIVWLKYVHQYNSGFDSLIGLPTAYLFFVFLVTTVWMTPNKFWVYILLSLPVIAWWIALSANGLFLSIFFAALGYLIAWGINNYLIKKTLKSTKVTS